MQDLFASLSEMSVAQLGISVLVAFVVINLLPRLLGGALGGALKGGFQFLGQTVKSMDIPLTPFKGSWPKIGKAYSWGSIQNRKGDMVDDIRIAIGRKKSSGKFLSRPDTVLWIRPNSDPNAHPGETNIHQWRHHFRDSSNMS